MLKNIGLSVAGAITWLVTQAIGIVLAGWGHGWYGPVFASMPLLALYPIVFTRAFTSRSPELAVTVSILAAAIVLDLWLVASAFGYDHEYFVKMWKYAPGTVTVWFTLWAAWQLLAMVPLLSRMKA